MARRNRKFNFTAVVMLGSLVLALRTFAADSVSDTLSEVDISFFSANPKIPWGKDPFHKSGGFRKLVNEDEYEKPTLSGILFGDGNPVAIVNNNAVMVGDHVGDRAVVEIGRTYVILEKGDSLIELQLGSSKAGGSE